MYSTFHVQHAILCGALIAYQSNDCAAFPPQTKLQRAQQQRQLVQDFAADVQRSLDSEIAGREAAAAAQARLRYTRARLDELRAINADRQRRANEAAAEAARLQVRL